MKLSATAFPFLCAVCNSRAGVEVLTIENYPAYLVPFPPQIAESVACSPLHLAACTQCGHLQQNGVDQRLQRLIYEVDYDHDVVDSAEAMAPHYRQPFSDFAEHLAREKLMKRGELLEIGCSAGERVPFLLGLSTSYTGVDPSDWIRTARERFPSAEFVQGYFPDAVSNRVYDTVVSQFNLEHILDPETFLKSVHTQLNTKGILLLQVPDVQFFLEEPQLNFLAHEHVQYFRRSTLDLLLRRCGFDSISWGTDGPSLICAARKGLPSDESLGHRSTSSGPRASYLVPSPP